MLSPTIRSPREDRRLLSRHHEISDTTSIVQIVLSILSSQPWCERGDGTWHQMRTLVSPHSPCTVKHDTDIINFAWMTWNFVLISASLSAQTLIIGIAFIAKFHPILM